MLCEIPDRSRGRQGEIFFVKSGIKFWLPN